MPRVLENLDSDYEILSDLTLIQECLLCASFSLPLSSSPLVCCSLVTFHNKRTVLESILPSLQAQSIPLLLHPQTLPLLLYTLKPFKPKTFHDLTPSNSPSNQL
jgi:hypothetical protein